VEFRKDYLEAECLLCYPGKDRMRVKDILFIPADEFLEALYPAKNLEKAVKAKICKKCKERR